MPEVTNANLPVPASTAPASTLPASTVPSSTVPVAAAESGAPTSSGRPGRRRLANRGWYRLIAPVAVLLLWQLVSSAGLIPAQKLPPPTAVWHTAVSLVTTDSPAYGTLHGAMLVACGQFIACSVLALAVGGATEGLTTRGFIQALGVARNV